MFNINRFRIDRKIQNTVFAITLLFMAYGCGENTALKGGGEDLPAVTPIDNISDSSMFGTYTINSYTKTDDHGTNHIFNGDNVTGELVIDYSSIRYRFQYDDGEHSYYTYNLDDLQDPFEQRALRNSIKNGTDGNGILSENQIVFNNFEATKISNEIKDLKDTEPDQNFYMNPYKYQLTNIHTLNSDGTSKWNFEGTYVIEEIIDVRNNHYTPNQWGDWRISFKFDSFIKNLDNDLCAGLSFYQVSDSRVNEFPYDPTFTAQNYTACSIGPVEFDSVLVNISTGRPFDYDNPTNSGTRLSYQLHKRYDAIRF